MLVVTIEQYFAGKPHTFQQECAALDLLTRVSALLKELPFVPQLCPNTGTAISGSKGGSGDGGFRLPTATTGSSLSSHKEARGIDIYDSTDALDLLLTDAILSAHGLYREAAAATPHWCHLTTRAPASGHRTFLP